MSSETTNGHEWTRILWAERESWNIGSVNGAGPRGGPIDEGGFSEEVFFGEETPDAAVGAVGGVVAEDEVVFLGDRDTGGDVEGAEGDVFDTLGGGEGIAVYEERFIFQLDVIAGEADEAFNEEMFTKIDVGVEADGEVLVGEDDDIAMGGFPEEVMPGVDVIAGLEGGRHGAGGDAEGFGESGERSDEEQDGEDADGHAEADKNILSPVAHVDQLAGAMPMAFFQRERLDFFDLAPARWVWAFW
jgi:hypothetical protein